MTDLLPLFVNLAGRRVVLVGAGPVAASKLSQLVAAGARVRVVAPAISESVTAQAARFLGRSRDESEEPAIDIIPRRFIPSDLDHAWLAVAAATPEVNREVADAAEARHIFVNAVDDPANASAFLSGVIRRDGVTVAISTNGDAPALTSLLREALDAVLPRDLSAWMSRARAERIAWKHDRVPMDARKPRLLRVLNALYDENGRGMSTGEAGDTVRVPWLDAPESSWL